MKAATRCASRALCACGRISRRKRPTRLSARGRFTKGRNFHELAKLNASCVCDILRIVMCPDKTHLAINLRRAFGSAPPEKIAQEAYEGNPKHLHRLARLRRGAKGEVSALWKYTQDLIYSQTQG